MPYCTRCGANNPDGSSFCSSCGAPLTAEAPQTYAAPPQPQYIVTQPQYVPPVETGGMLAWAIITLLLCTIPGIVAIVKTTQVNKSFTVEEQQQKLQSAKIWCIVGTVLGVLAVIGMLAAR